MADPSIGGHPLRPELLVVGAASRDLDGADPRGWRLGGGVTYGSLACARLGLQVQALIGVDGLAAPAAELDLLRAAGVDIELTPLARGPVLDNQRSAHGRVQFVAQAGDPLPAAALPVRFRDTAAVLLAPIAGELGADWARAVRQDAFVALAWQGLARRLEAGRPMVARPLRRSALVARAQIAQVSAEDAAGGGPPLTNLLRDGQQLVVTHGRHGAVHVERHRGGLRARFVPSYPPGREVDPTGAGDVFLAAWTASLLSAPDHHMAGARWRALAVAAAAASLNVEAAGLTGVPTLRQVCGRLMTPLEQPAARAR